MKQLKDTLRAKFRNISSIMDCVSCETCKVSEKESPNAIH